MTCKHYLISGRVQGVFYRSSTRETAQRLGLQGWVKNRPDGRVEAVACGSEQMLAKLEAWLHQGPPMARVEYVEIETTSMPDCNGFEIRC
jgi:acylphosphatase